MPLTIKRDDEEPTDPFGEPTPVVEDGGEAEHEPPDAAENMESLARYRQLWADAKTFKADGDEVADGFVGDSSEGEDA